MRSTTYVVVLALTLAVGLAAAQAWEPVASLPSPRYSGEAVFLGGKVYYIGGSVVGGLKTNTVFVHDTALATWNEAETLNVARHRFGTAALDGKIYVFGGWGNGGVLLKSAECYDTATGHWSFIETLPGGRASVFSGATIFGGLRVWCAGGWTGTQALSENLAFDPATGHWRTLASMPTALCEGMSACDGSALYCAGGTHDGGAPVATFLIYDALSDVWYTHWPDMPAARMAGAGVSDGGGVWIIGGVLATGATTAVDEQIDYHRVWREDEPIPEPRRFCAACLVPPDSTGWYAHMYILGGLDSLLQPVATVWRGFAPLGVEEKLVVPAYHGAGTSIVRAGTSLEAPEVTEAVGTMVAADGRVAAIVHPGDSCPAVAAGLYVVRWQARGAAAVTRAVIVVR
jgi:N-acetylneuraminic acid mutarotase